MTEPSQGWTRHLPLAGTRNLRDIGGYPAGDGRRTRWRTVLRTDSLDRLPPDSQAALIALGLRLVVDLRWPHELDRAPSVFAGSRQLQYRHVPLVEDRAQPDGIAATYRHILDTRARELALVARHLLDDGLPAIIGCAAGVDRTGVTTALLLSLVGVPGDVVAADYALSVESFRGDGRQAGLDDWRGGPVTLDCRPEYMADTLEHLQRRHGGPRALLRRHGFTDVALDILADRLTEPAAPGS